MKTRDDLDNMLARIRNALGGGAAPADGSSARPRPALPEIGNVLPPTPRSGWVDQFEGELRKVDGVPHRAASTAELDSVLRSLLDAAPPGPVVVTANPLLDGLCIVEKVRAWGRDAAAWLPGLADEPTQLARFRSQCFAAPVGVSGVAFALAESGSLVLTSASEGSQLVSLAPPLHIALYTRSQVEGSLEAVLAQLQNPAAGSALEPGRSVVFITGPSRTADIEQISIRGVHGPTHVHAILIEGELQAAAEISNTRLAQSSESK